LSSLEFFVTEAESNYQKYLRVQAAIEELEGKALEAAQGVKRAQKQRLEDEKTEGGFAYKNLCSDRKRYMELAQLNATMAIMLKA
jgi:hypothetical protein